MQWREISHRELLAEGNGQVISSTDIRGIGLVLKYDRVGQTRLYNDLIPSNAVDKLRCGILPGFRLPCFEDYQHDLQLIGDDGLPSLILGHLLWVSQEARDHLEVIREPALWSRNRRYWSPVNDWISVSIRGCTACSTQSLRLWS